MSSTKITAPAVRDRKQGPKITVVTAYDATLARLFDEAGVDILLVGDSLGMVVQGMPNTLAVTLDEICYHSRAVARGTRRAQVVADMPFMSFQVSVERALDAAGRLVKEGACEAVKLEGGSSVAEQVRRIVDAGIPVMGHVGLTPQSVHAMGGFRVQGKRGADAERIVSDAKVLEEAGVYCLVVEGVPRDVGERITQAVSVPTIGIGAGPHCDGQVLVCYDLLGMYRDIRPKFVKRYAELGDAIADAGRRYVEEVQAGTFPGEEHSFAPRSSPETGARPVVDAPAEGYGPADESGER